jgi:hypothetical protein
MPRPLLLLFLALALGLIAPASAAARHGEDDGGGSGGGDEEVRVSGICGSGASSELRVRAHHGGIEVEWRVRRGRSGERWSVVLVHERRVDTRTTATTSGSSGSFRIRRTLDDFDGADEITARASGPRGRTCQATAVLAG